MVHNKAQKMPGHVELRGRDPSQRHAHNEITFTALDKGKNSMLGTLFHALYRSRLGGM